MAYQTKVDWSAVQQAADQLAALPESQRLERVWQRIPVELRDFQLQSQQKVGNTGTVTYTLPQLAGLTQTAKITVSNNVAYTPTAADEALATASGVPIFGLSYTFDDRSDRVVTRVKGYVQTDASGRILQSQASAVRGASVRTRTIPGAAWSAIEPEATAT